MEYFIGILLFVIGLAIPRLYDKVSKIEKNDPLSQIRLDRRQSDIYRMIKPAIPYMPIERKETQSLKHLRSQSVRVIIMDSNAYWIRNNQFFVSKIDEDGNISPNSAKVVDIMGMDKVELDRMSFIVEKLTEGDDHDSGNSRN